MKGVTDHLLSIACTLSDGELAHARRQAELVLDLHLVVLHDLQLSEDHDLRVRRELKLLGRDLLHEVPAHGSVTAGAERFDRLASFGERFSARLFAAALEKSGVPAVPVTSSDFVLTCDTFRDAQPHLEQTKQRGRDVLLPLLEAGVVSVVTGFIGATPDGRITTLGRNSSDFSGAIIAHVVDADELVIWTDVDGIYTANPNESAEARLLHELSYDEAHALAASARKFSTRKCFLSPPNRNGRLGPQYLQSAGAGHTDWFAASTGASCYCSYGKSSARRCRLSSQSQNGGDGNMQSKQSASSTEVRVENAGAP